MTDLEPIDTTHITEVVDLTRKLREAEEEGERSAKAWYDTAEKHWKTVLELQGLVRELAGALREAVAIFDGEMGTDWADEYGHFWESQNSSLSRVARGLTDAE